jgi:hypothetical protein
MRGGGSAHAANRAQRILQQHCPHLQILLHYTVMLQQNAQVCMRPYVRGLEHRRKPLPMIFISEHVLCECAAWTLGSFFLDPEEVRSLSLRAMWNFSKETELPWLGHQIMGHKGLSNGLGAPGPKGLKLNHYSIHHPNMNYFWQMKTWYCVLKKEESINNNQYNKN